MQANLKPFGRESTVGGSIAVVMIAPAAVMIVPVAVMIAPAAVMAPIAAVMPAVMIAPAAVMAPIAAVMPAVMIAPATAVMVPIVAVLGERHRRERQGRGQSRNERKFAQHGNLSLVPPENPLGLIALVIIIRMMVVIPMMMMMIPIVMMVPIVMMMIRTTKQPVEDCLARIAYLPTAPILVTHHVSLTDAVVAPKRVQRQGGRAGRKDDTAGGCK